jgi:ABC-type antimicrobial peptide transport system permease subunit
MRDVFLKMATRTNWRILVTVIGIAACVMYVTGTTAMVSGLDTGTDALAARVNEGPYLALDGASLEESRIPASVLDLLEGNSTICWTSWVDVEVESIQIGSTYAVACNDSSSMIKPDFSSFGNESIWIGQRLKEDMEARNITLQRGDDIVLDLPQGNLTLDYYRTFAYGYVFSPDWILVSENATPPIGPGDGHLSFLLIPKENTEDLERLREEGLTLIPTTGTVAFFQAGINQVESTLYVISISTSVIIAVLVASLMSVEVYYRRNDIEILRQIGSSPSLITGIFAVQTLYVSIFGGLLGITLGFVVTSFITSFAPLLGYASFVVPQATITSVLIPFLLALIFGLVGGLPVAALASRKVKREGLTR